LTIDVESLKTAQERAWGLYQTAKANLETAAKASDPAVLAAAAQTANDAWLEFKKMENQVTQGLILQRMRDSYHV
jgi:hypothetical protein